MILRGNSLLLLAALQLSAQVVSLSRSLPDTGAGRVASVGTRNPVTAGLPVKVLPKIVCGDGWETAVTLVNVGTGPLSFQQFFRDADGSAAPMTVRGLADSEPQTAAGVQGTLVAHSTVTLTVFDDKGPFREGWSILSYDGELGGYAVVRRRARKGDFDLEASIPLSSMQDFLTYLPFDNTQGFRTQLTLLNPASNLAAQVRLTYYSAAGELLLIDSMVMKPGQQTTLVVPDTYPDLANRTGTARVEANINRFSIAGLRLNPNSGAITSLPAVGQSGVLQ